MSSPWYHCIELAAGEVTPGLGFENVVLTRALLARVAVEGMRCLDVGTMDGLVAVLMARRGAREVVAIDRLDRSEQVNVVRERLGVDFEYRPGTPARALPSLVEATGPFDVVVLSGVLYHALDPLAVLAAARGAVRNGGMLVVETAAVDDDGLALHFNAHGRFYPGDNYWMPGTACLDYLLRMLRLRPLDLVHHRQHDDRLDGTLALHRVAVACRAEPEPVVCGAGDDAWMESTVGPEFALDIGSWVDWARLESDAAAVAFDGPGAFPSNGYDALSVAEAVRTRPETHGSPVLARSARA